MAKMDPKSNNRFESGNTTRPNEYAPVVNFDAMAKDGSILLIVTVDQFGKVTAWNHPKTPDDEKLKDITDVHPYPNAGVYDVANITLVTYQAGSFVELGIWNPGPPRTMYS